MAEFDDKLNSILSNPDAMAQIMQLAQSLSGGTGGNNAANAPPPPPSQPGGSSPGWGQQPQTPPPSGGDPLSALAGGLDPQLLLRFLPLIQELGGARDSNARQLRLYMSHPSHPARNFRPRWNRRASWRARSTFSCRSGLR